MRYKIEIWQYHGIVETYESNDIKDILKWYKNNWKYTYECGDCSFSICDNNKELSFDEVYELGFYED